MCLKSGRFFQSPQPGQCLYNAATLPHGDVARIFQSPQPGQCLYNTILHLLCCCRQWTFSPLNRGNASTICPSALNACANPDLSVPSTGAMPLQFTTCLRPAACDTFSPLNRGNASTIYRPVASRSDHRLSVPSTGAMPLQFWIRRWSCASMTDFQSPQPGQCLYNRTRMASTCAYIDLSVPSTGAMPLQCWYRQDQSPIIPTFSPLNRGNASTICNAIAWLVLSWHFQSPQPGQCLYNWRMFSMPYIQRTTFSPLNRGNASTMLWDRYMRISRDGLSVPSTGAMPLQSN